MLEWCTFVNNNTKKKNKQLKSNPTTYQLPKNDAFTDPISNAQQKIINVGMMHL